MPLLPGHVSSEADRAEIAPQLWEKCISGLDVPVPPDLEPIGSLARALAVPKNGEADAVRIAAFLRQNGLPAADAMSLTATTTLIPRSAMGSKAMEEAIQSAGFPMPGWRTILAEAELLRS